MPKIKLRGRIVYSPDDPVIVLLSQLLGKVSNMSTILDQVNATLDQVKANQDRQTALLAGLVAEIAALRQTGEGGASASDLAAIEAKLTAVIEEGAASIAAVPGDDLPPEPPMTPITPIVGSTG